FRDGGGLKIGLILHVPRSGDRMLCPDRCCLPARAPQLRLALYQLPAIHKFCGPISDCSRPVVLVPPAIRLTEPDNLDKESPFPAPLLICGSNSETASQRKRGTE